jgi:hypothetical protein
MRTLPSAKSFKGDGCGAAYWNTNTICTMSLLPRMLYSLTIDIEHFFLTKNEKKRKKNVEETYQVVL